MCADVLVLNCAAIGKVKPAAATQYTCRVIIVKNVLVRVRSQLCFPETESRHEPECSFPQVFQGSWLLMENRLPEYVTVTGGLLQSPLTFGQMICKVRHRQPTAFTVVYVFSNGW